LLSGRRNELYSAFSNLVFNAVQYTPAGGRITVMWYADAGGAHFEVADTGPGIAAHHIDRLTERFYRVDSARSRELGGTGLGLAIVKHVLTRHGATLRIDSELGEGSRFICDFPAERIQSRSGAAPGGADPFTE
jgi:two-component system phosphate regulon sensor histidine kinase PhoR